MKSQAPYAAKDQQANGSQPRLTVLMVSTSYPSDSKDWKGVFIRHMASALSSLDSVSLRLWHPPGNVPERSTYVATASEALRLEQLMDGGGIAHLMRTRPVLGVAEAFRLLALLRNLYRREKTVDVYHVNWLQNALPLPHDGRPLLVTVLGTDMQLLKVPGMVVGLRRAFGGRSVAICPNAKWMVPDLRRRFGDVAEVTYVPFGIDPCWFDVGRAWKLDEPARWLCVTRLTQAKLGTLFAWGNPYFSGGKRELHLFGPMQEEVDLPDWVHYHGPMPPDALCKEWFPQACGLITMSQHAEGRPQVMLEAMAAGLPIIASRLPAHDDLLRHRETGWLCGQATEVGDALEVFEGPDTNTSIGLRARAWVAREVGTWDDCAARYVKLYQDLIGGHKG